MLRSAIVAAVRPTARVASAGAVALTVGAATVPAMVSVVRDRAVRGGAVILPALVCGAALAWAADDPAREVLAATPVPGAARTLLRVGVAVVVSSLVAGLGLVASALGPGLPGGLSVRTSECAAAAAVGLAAGLVAMRRGERAAGATGVTCGVLLPAMLGALAQRWPERVPGFVVSAAHDRWWLVAIVGSVVALHAGRDAGARTVRVSHLGRWHRVGDAEGRAS